MAESALRYGLRFMHITTLVCLIHARKRFKICLYDHWEDYTERSMNQYETISPHSYSQRYLVSQNCSSTTHKMIRLKEQRNLPFRKQRIHLWLSKGFRWNFLWKSGNFESNLIRSKTQRIFISSQWKIPWSKGLNHWRECSSS